ncbi:hypothetical protein [Streptomyces sp. NBC_00557]|uniref:hypothetical protein n=1 Tax=Streptomyces sp. NBC_00557 TaxID=2975776 RepID=UPI002E816D52|nr:hypothetical protein [Streptomyces sp. NBC_00557]WUC34449.1 hypothetical protein OG956_09620 [Streptomyces sp. NBC_00557]
MAGRRRVDTWIHICNEIIHHVLPSRTRTVHLLVLVTVPPAVLGGFFTVLFTVLVPDPGRWLGVLGCSAGVLVTARLRRWLGRRAPVRELIPAEPAGRSDAGPEPSASGEPPGGESAPTNLRPP